MPRLDVWLVEQGFFESRQAGKRAIKDGLVTINGKIAKPSKQVTGTEDIIVSDDARDLPLGYKKLKQLDDAVGGKLVNSETLALDIGSSAGGFLSYLDEKGATSIGIEVADTFIPMLKKLAYHSERISLIEGDAFFIEPEEICEIGELDLLLIDVTTGPDGTIRLIERFSCLLKQDGILIAAFKSKIDDEVIRATESRLPLDTYTDVQSIVIENTRKEFHLIARRH